MLMMLALRWHSMAALVEPSPADAHDAGFAVYGHDAGAAVAFNGCLGGA